MHATAVHQLPPPMMSQYPRQSLNGAHVNGNSSSNTAVSSSSLAARKRKRGHQLTVNYSEVQEVDPEGRLRDVIVIEDTPPPPPTLSPATTRNGGYSASYQPANYSGPIRTRARAAQEEQTLSAMSVSTSSGGLPPPPPKKRKRDLGDEPPRAPPAKKAYQQPPVSASSKSFAVGSGSGTAETSKGPVACDDKEGHYIIVPDDMIYRRYRTIKLLGQGTFGKVVEAIDTHTNNRVAVKIIRAIPKYRDASKIEVRVMQKLKERDPMNRNKCIHLLNWFDHRNHICLVSELLGICVYDFLKENEFQPFPRLHIQQFARQLLTSVAFIHDLHLIHTDLKPENILLVRNDYKTINLLTQKQRNAPPRQKRLLVDTDIRLIDFGSATFQEEYHSTVVSTRHYRAPEIILGLGWSFPCDAYSLGCILVEFFTGVALYQTHDNLEHLAMMEMVMGKMPDRFARAGARSKAEFFKDSKLDWPKPKATRQSKKDVKATRSLAEVLNPTHDQINKEFYDLVRSLLAFDPAQRATVKEALQHPYFSLTIPSPVNEP